MRIGTERPCAGPLVFLLCGMPQELVFLEIWEIPMGTMMFLEGLSTGTSAVGDATWAVEIRKNESIRIGAVLEFTEKKFVEDSEIGQMWMACDECGDFGPLLDYLDERQHFAMDYLRMEADRCNGGRVQAFHDLMRRHCKIDVVKERKTVDRTFRMGEVVKTGSYNLIYMGAIVGITEKSVFAKERSYSDKRKRFTVEQFISENWDFDVNEATKQNWEWRD